MRHLTIEAETNALPVITEPKPIRFPNRQAKGANMTGEPLDFPDVPELDFVAEAAEEFDQHLYDVHKYLLWSRRYALCHALSEEHVVAYGMMLKYHRKLFNLELLPAEAEMVRKSVGAIKTSNAILKTEGADALTTRRSLEMRSHDPNVRYSRRGRR